MSTPHQESFRFHTEKLYEMYERVQGSMNLPPQVSAYMEDRQRAKLALETSIQILCILANVTELRSVRLGKTFKPSSPTPDADPGSYTTI